MTQEGDVKVFGHPMSTCYRAVLTTLLEKGHEAEFVMVDLMKGEQKQPAHLARQPFGVVPAIDDNGFILYESRAIIRYLDQTLAGPALTPTDAKERARMEQWIGVEQSYFTPAAMKIIRQRMFASRLGKPTDEAIVTEGIAETAKVLDIAAETLKQGYFVKAGFSLADICWMPYVQYLFTSGAGSLITERPAVAAWWERVSSRPSWKKVAG
jgi:glutathione S-transferase